MSCYANASEIFTPQETHNHMLEAWAQNKLFQLSNLLRTSRAKV